MLWGGQTGELTKAFGDDLSQYCDQGGWISGAIIHSIVWGMSTKRQWELWLERWGVSVEGGQEL